MRVKTITRAALVAALLSAAGTLAPTMPAQAQVSVGFNVGNVAFGFSDGYWDRGHVWHPWPSPAAHRSFRARHPAHFRPHPHTRYRNAGWGKRWW